MWVSIIIYKNRLYFSFGVIFFFSNILLRENKKNEELVAFIEEIFRVHAKKNIFRRMTLTFMSLQAFTLFSREIMPKLLKRQTAVAKGIAQVHLMKQDFNDPARVRAPRKPFTGNVR